MIKSMTGFGKVNFADENVNLDIEIKSINHRYLDVSVRMPYQLNFMEDKITKTCREFLKRGKVDISIRSKTKSIGKSNVQVDFEAAKDMKDKLDQIANITGISETSTISISDILKNEDVLRFEAQELDENYLVDIVIENLKIALSKLVNMRENEGGNLYRDLSSNINRLVELRNQIENFVVDIKNEIRNKLIETISQFLDSEKIDNDRLANEIVYYADKADINEELTRLDSHFDQFLTTLKSEDSVGKKLDFLTQEMLRETNTIASKSSKIEVTNNAIEMKTIIEKIKEQVQNIE